MFASPDSALDTKVLTLWQLYADNYEVATSLKDVEGMRNSATNLGIMTSIAAFGLNEVARLAMRSRKYLFSKAQTGLSINGEVHNNNTRMTNSCDLTHSHLQAQGAERCILRSCSFSHEPLQLPASYQRTR